MSSGTDVENRVAPTHTPKSDDAGTHREWRWFAIGLYSIIAAICLLGIGAAAPETPILWNLGVFFIVCGGCIMLTQMELIQRLGSDCPDLRPLFSVLAVLKLTGGTFSYIFFHYTGDRLARDFAIILTVAGCVSLCLLRRAWGSVLHKLVVNPEIRVELALFLCFTASGVLVALHSVPMPTEPRKKGNFEAAMFCMSMLVAFSVLVMLTGYREIITWIKEASGCD